MRLRFVRVFLGPSAVCASLLASSSLKAAEADNTARQSVNLEALSRLKGLDLEANPAVKKVVLKVLDQVQGTPQFVEIVRDFNLSGQDERLLDIAAKRANEADGVEAMRLVLKGTNSAALKAQLDSTNGVQIIQALGNTAQNEIVPLLQPLVNETNRTVADRKAAVNALAKVQEGAAALLELVRAGKLPDDLRPTATSALNGVRWENLKSQAAELLPMPKSQNSQPLPPVSELVARTGDPQKGAAVFRREIVGCYKCHQVNGEGTDFGPSLSEIGTKLAKAAIYESILDPSAGIAFGYEAWRLELKDGDDALGLIVSETPAKVVLKSVGGIVTRYNKSDIVRRTKQKLSIMPAGLEQTMSTEDLVDLVEYLSSLKKAAK